MKTFKKFLESCEAINEAEYNKEWWDSKSDAFQKRYIERHPNSIYAQKAGATSSVKPTEKKDSSVDTSKMTPKQKAKHYSNMLNPKQGSRYFAGQYVNPDNDDLPDDVLVDDDGKIIGFSNKDAFAKYGKKPTAQDKAANKELSNWLGSDDYNKVYNPDAKPSKSTKSPKMSSAQTEKLSKYSKNPKELESIGTSLLDSKDKTNSRMYALGRLGKNPNTPDHILKRIEKEEPYEMLDSPRASKEFLDNQVKALDPTKNYTWVDMLVQNPALDKNHKKTLNDKLNASLSKTKDKYMKDRIQWQLDLLNGK